MIKHPAFSIGLALFLGGILVYVNRDWFSAEPIQIYHRIQPGRSFSPIPQATDAPLAVPIFFGFNRKLRLTSVQVVPLEGSSTNRPGKPVWHLVASSSSVPTQGFVYAGEVPGMHPTAKGTAAGPLFPGVRYRLLLEARSLKAQHDFSLGLDDP